MTKKSVEDIWIGTVTVGERGQVVIPADARKKLDINHGDKLFAISHPSEEGLMLFKMDGMRDVLNHLAERLNLVYEEAAGSKSEVASEKI